MQVFQEKLDGKDWEPRWKIVTEEPVDAEDFVVKIGQVPEGFNQVIPPEGQEFKPVAGRKYHIAPKIVGEQMPWPSTPFIAE